MKKRIGAVDGLRGIAILMVLLYHAIAWTPGLENLPLWNPMQIFKFGFSGVDLFFVLSGFSLTYAWLSRENQQTMPPLRKYYQRRFWRIYPPYIIAFTIPWAVSFITENRSNAMEAILHIFLVQNFSSEYFYGVNGPLWSIAVEAQFYVVFPFLMILLTKYRHVGGWVIVGVVSACLLYRTGIAFMFINDTYRQVPKPFLQGFLLSRIPNFLFGMAIAWQLLKSQTNGIKPLIRPTLLFWCGIVVHLFTWISIYYFRHASMVWREMGFALGYGLIVFAAVSQKTSSMFENRFLKFTGKVSFSMYLIHAPILLGFYYLIRENVHSPSLAVGFIVLAASIAIAYATGWAFYEVIEKRFYKISQSYK